MPTHYPKHVREAVWTLLTARPKLTHSEIRRRLRDKEAGLSESVEIPRSSFYTMRAALIREKGCNPEEWIDPGAELDVTDEIMRRGLSLAMKEVRELEKTAQESGKPQGARGLKLARDALALRRAIENPNPHSPRARKGGQARQANAATRPESTLERLAAQANGQPE